MEAKEHAAEAVASLKRLFQRHRSLFLIFLNILFVALAIVGGVGQNTTLPLWLSTASGNPNCSNGPDSNSNNTASMDPYFVLTSASFSFTLIFGGMTIISALAGHVDKEDLRFPQLQFILVGLSDALNGVLVVYAAPGSRTAPFLQAILGNVLIPLTILLRLIILRKKPTLLKLISAGLVTIGLVVALVPVITGLDKGSEEGKHEWAQQPTVARVLWPVCFMIGFVPASIMNVIEEKTLKDKRSVNLFYFLFWSSLYQLIAMVLMFWTDIIPGFGYTNGINDFGKNYWFALRCFFGQAGCDYRPGLRGSMFIFMYVISYIFSGLLLRYAEGATYLAIVQTLVTPLGALFWSLFQNDSCGNFWFEPHADYVTYFSIGGIILIVPSIVLYNIGTIDKLMNAIKKLFLCSRTESENSIQTERSPLLN